MIRIPHKDFIISELPSSLAISIRVSAIFLVTTFFLALLFNEGLLIMLVPVPEIQTFVAD